MPEENTKKLRGYRPVKTNYISQKFDDNRACINSKGQVKEKINNVCLTGFKEFYKSIGMKSHGGFDFAGIRGENVYHSFDFDGIVRTEIDWAGGVGVDVISLKPVLLLDGREAYVKCRYWHNLKNLVHDGQLVNMGDKIALCNSTGASSGNHVHFGLKEVKYLEGKEYDYLKKEQRYVTLNKDNGWYGGIDPEPYFENQFVGSVIEFFEGSFKLLEELKRQLMMLQVYLLKDKLNSLKKLVGGLFIKRKII